MSNTPNEIAKVVLTSLRRRKGFDWWYDDISDANQIEIEQEVAWVIALGMDIDTCQNPECVSIAPIEGETCGVCGWPEVDHG